jgi:hypothetical protein
MITSVLLRNMEGVFIRKSSWFKFKFIMRYDYGGIWRFPVTIFLLWIMGIKTWIWDGKGDGTDGLFSALGCLYGTYIFIL